MDIITPRPDRTDGEITSQAYRRSIFSTVLTDDISRSNIQLQKKAS